MNSMNKTFTPELTPEVMDRLRDYARLFQDDFTHESQRSWSGVYLRGLIQDGERKSIEPMVGRVPLPAQLRAIRDPEQALQQFVNQSPWDEQQVFYRYRTVMAGPFAGPQGIFVLDDTGFPKQGKHSVGVQHQYCGQLGKKANCQVAVTVHYVSPKGHFPAALRLFLPQSWTDSPERLEQAGVPQEYRRAQTKGQIALELLDWILGERLLPGDVVITDAGYGVAEEFRAGLQQRGLFYIAGVNPEMVVFPAEPRWDWPAEPPSGGRRRPRLAAGSPRPVSLKALAERLPRHKVTWREGTKGKLSAKFAWVRVWPGQGWAEGACAGAEPIWLLIEEPAGGYQPDQSGSALEESLAGGARLPANEGRTGIESFRGPVVAWLPSSRLPGDVGLWLPGVGTTPSEGGPGCAGEKKGLAAPNNPAGGPPRVAATPQAHGQAGLHLLQSTCSCF